MDDCSVRISQEKGRPLASRASATPRTVRQRDDVGDADDDLHQVLIHALQLFGDRHVGLSSRGGPGHKVLYATSRDLGVGPWSLGVDGCSNSHRLAIESAGSFGPRRSGPLDVWPAAGSAPQGSLFKRACAVPAAPRAGLPLSVAPCERVAAIRRRSSAPRTASFNSMCSWRSGGTVMSWCAQPNAYWWFRARVRSCPRGFTIVLLASTRVLVPSNGRRRASARTAQCPPIRVIGWRK